MTFCAYSKRTKPVFTGSRRLQSFYNGIPGAGTEFLELEQYSEENNGILKSGTVFWDLERYFGFWNVVLALRMLPGKPRRYFGS